MKAFLNNFDKDDKFIYLLIFLTQKLFVSSSNDGEMNGISQNLLR
jgi:hypothetical protein